MQQKVYQQKLFQKLNQFVNSNLKMHRKQQEVRRPFSGKPYQTSPAQFFPIQHNQSKPFHHSRVIENQRIISIPFNQTSAVNLSSGPVQILKQYNPIPKTSSHLKVYPFTKKIYFTYFHPDDLKVQRRYIQTIVHRQEKPYTNQWEQRYFELQKQMVFFMQSHQKMSEEFIKIKQELKIHNQLSFQNTLQNFKTQSLMNTQNQRQQNLDLIQKYDNLNLKYKEMERQAGIFKQQNIRMQNMIQKLQTQLISEKNLIYKIETLKNQYMMQLKQYQFNIKDISADKNRLESQIYDLKLVLASKNLQIQQLLEKCEKSQIIKVIQNNQNKKQIEYQNITKQKFQDRLTRIRTQYEKKQRKMEKLLESHNKEASELRKLILQLQQKQKASKQLKQRYQKLYNQKKQQVLNLRRTQQNLLSANQDERQIVYFEQKIKELTTIDKQQAQKIKKLQKANKQLNKKIQQYQDNYVSQEQLEVLHSAIEKNKNHILEKGGVNYDELNNKVNPYFNGKIFQEKMIYELKKDNLKLIEMIQKFNMNQFVKQPQTALNQNITINQQSGSHMSLAMQSMISEIYFKIQRITEGVKYNSSKGSQRLFGTSPQKTKRSQDSPTKKNKKRAQTNDQQNSMNYKISNDLQILKVYVVDLSSTCQKLVKKLQTQQKTHNVAQKQQSTAIFQQRRINQIMPKDAELMQFYKTKNKQLQERVNQLIGLSNMLKQKLSEKHPQQNSGEEYWKNQIKAVHNQSNQLRSRYEKLLAQYQKSQDKKQQYETKVALYSMQIQRLAEYKKQCEQLNIKIFTIKKQQEQITRVKNSMERQLKISTHRLQQMNIKIQEYMKLILIKDKQISELNVKNQEVNKKKFIIENQYKEYIMRTQQKLKDYGLLQGQFVHLQGLKKRYEQFEVTHQSVVQKYHRQIDLERKNYKNLIKQLEDIKQKLWHTEQQNRQLNIQISRLHEVKSKQPISFYRPSNLYYYALERLRSRILESETLTAELAIQISKRNQHINKCLYLAINQQLHLVGELTGIFQTGNTHNFPKQDDHNNQLKAKIQSLQSRIRSNVACNRFKQQFLRSLLIQCDTLLQQIKITQSRDKQIIQTIKLEINKALQTVSSFDLF